MKYINSLVFLGLMIFVAGCQKKEQQPKKNAHKGAQKAAHVKKEGPTKLETKKSVAKQDDKKVAQKKAQSAKKAAPAKKANDKKHVAKKDDKKSKDKAKN